jgi:hypothetical protein
MAAHPEALALWKARLVYVRRMVGEWIRSPHLPFYFDWNVRSTDECLFIHRWARASAFPWRPSLRWLALAVGGVAWPLKSLVLAFRCARRFGPAVIALEHKPIRRQALEQLWLAWTKSVSPYDYYTYGLYRSDLIHRSGRFLYGVECGSLLPALSNHVSAELLNDKVRFAEHLHARGIATPLPIAWTHDGALVFRAGPGTTLPPTDLFIKPVAGFGGHGAMSWEYVGEEMYRSESAHAFCASLGLALPGVASLAVLRAANLAELVLWLSAHMEMMVQERLTNHPEMGDLSNGALLGLRVLTGSIDGRAEFLRGAFKMPVGRSVTVNFGIVAPIDEATGVLGSATPFGPDTTRFTHHPDTGAPIAGRQVPEWNTIKSLAIAAHEALPDYTFVGWDLALTPQGVVVLEGNPGWGAESLQKPHGSPLMDTRFMDICLARIRQLRENGRATPRPRLARAPVAPVP